MIAAFLLTAVLAQQSPEVETSIRPERVRVGQPAVLSVLVRSESGVPEYVDFRPPDGVVLVDVRGSRSTLVGNGGRPVQNIRRTFRIEATAPGVYVLPGPTVFFSDRVIEGPPVTLSVEPGPAPPPYPPEPPDEEEPRRDLPGPSRVPAEPGAEPEETLPGDIPEYPWSWQWYGPELAPYSRCLPWFPYPPFGTPYRRPRVDPDGRFRELAPVPGPSGCPVGPWFPGRPLVPGRPGAFPGTTPFPPPSDRERQLGAEEDPWWVEVVPEFLDFFQVVEDPSGALTLGMALAPGRTVWEGQQLTLLLELDVVPEATLYLDAYPRVIPPEPEGVRVVDLPDVSPGVPAARDGRVTRAYTYRRAYFPTLPGSLVLPAARVRYRIGPGADMRTGGAPDPPVNRPRRADELDRRREGESRNAPGERTLVTEPVSLTVRSIPVEAAPAEYGGAVGRFRIRTEVERTRIAVGESTILTAVVTGAGYLPSLPRPAVEADPLAGVRPLSEESYLRTLEGVVGGRKVFRWLVVPRAAGRIRLGPVLLSYFDPWVGDFGTVASDEFELEVIEVPGGDGDGARYDGP